MLPRRLIFVPPPEVRQLRDLTRLRVQVTGEHTRIHKCIHKVLEDANTKLDKVLSDLPGVSGRAMLEGPIARPHRSGWLADYARGSLRGKREELELVLRGSVIEHHRYLLAELMTELEFLEERLARLDRQLAVCMEPDVAQLERLCGIPGVDLLTAWTLIADGRRYERVPGCGAYGELGWLVSGQPESAGKHLSRRTKKGNRWIRRALCQSAWAVTSNELSFDSSVLWDDGSLRHEESDCGGWAAISLTSSARYAPRTGRFGWSSLEGTRLRWLTSAD